MESSAGLSKDDYNKVPVHYCETCLSLKIIPLEKGSSICYCGDCGNVNINTASIEEWEKMKLDKNNGRES